jgi:hypothetical protein
MDYEYDVFISYKSGKVFGRWVDEVFYDFFKEFLGQSLGKDPSIFIDKSEIRDGDVWPERLKASLAKSKYMVAVVCPLYFQSQWCKTECSVMLHREAMLARGNRNNPQGLISGVTLHDGNRFPLIIQNKQFRMWHDYAVVGKGFENTVTYVKFQSELKIFAENVARGINQSPSFQEEWLQTEWLDLPVNQYPLSLLDNQYSQPSL